MRRVGAPPQNGIYYPPRTGAYAILLYGAKLLVTHQGGMCDEWQLPGGGVDEGEAILPALHREIYEETGWRAGNLRRWDSYKRYTYMPDYERYAEKRCHIFVGRALYPISAPTEPEHDAYLVDPWIIAGRLASSGDRISLKRYLQSRGERHNLLAKFG